MNINRNRIVRLVAIKRQYKQDKKPLVLCAIEDIDNGGALMTGLELLDKSQFDSLSDEIKSKKNDSISILDGEPLDLTNDYSLFRFCRCLIHDTIARSKEEINSKHLFYIHDEDYIAETDSKKTDLAFEAMEYISDFGDSQYKDLAIYLGINVTKMKPAILKSKVKESCMKNSEEVLKFKNLDNKDNNMVVRKAIVYNIIRRKMRGYYYGDSYLANSIDGVIVELFRTENAPLRSKILKTIAAIENPTDKGAIDDLIDFEQKDRDNTRLAEKDTEKRIIELKYQYLKLTKQEYEGPETIRDLEMALETITLEDNIEDTEEDSPAVKDFLSKCKKMDIKGIKTSLRMRKVDSSLFEDIDNKDELIKIGIANLKG